MDRIIFWYGNSRPYSIPITLLTWFVIFVYSLKSGGNFINGLIAYFGIFLVHLATNLSDDYFDYKRLVKDGKFDNDEKSVKCRYLLNGSATIEELGITILIMLGIAGFFGLVLLFLSGWYVILFALLALPIALFYSMLSSRGLGDFAVIAAYGPLMFEGVYYVMTKSTSLDVLILSFGCALFVNSVLYAHMLMDFDGDKESGKTTLCTRLKTKENALKGLLFFYIAGYLLIGYLGYRTSNIFYILPLLTVVLVIDLYKSLEIYNKDSKILPEVHFWNYPLDNWAELQHSEDAAFFLRFMYARNISTWFMLFVCLAIIMG